MVTEVDAATALVVTVKVALTTEIYTVSLHDALPISVLLLESVTWAPPAGAGPLRVTVPVEDCTPPTTLVGSSASDESVEGSEDPSKIQTAGFGSFNGTTTNFDGDTTYTTALPPDPEVIVMVPLPFV